MRKLILIAVIATMSSTPCFANLSLASNEPSPAVSGEQPPAVAEPQPSPEATEPQSSPVVTEPSKAREARAATVAKAPTPVKHRRSHVSSWTTPVRGFYQHCM